MDTEKANKDNDVPPLSRETVERKLREEAIHIEARETRQSFYDEDKFLPKRVVDHILKSLPKDTLLTQYGDKGGDTIWKYNEEKGIYESTGIPWIEQETQKLLGEEVTKSRLSEVTKLVQVETYVDSKDFQENPYVIVLLNGAYNAQTNQFLPHSQAHRAKSSLPLSYNHEAKCPTILKFLNEIFGENFAFMQEWVGYHLLKDYRYQRCVVLVGDGDNGKSTFLKLLSTFLGKENVSSETLFRLSNNRFSPAELYGKLANIAADIGPDELKHTGTIKTLTGGDWITVEKKNRDPFKFISHAKMTSSCNQLPRTPDETLAFFKRFIVILLDRIIPPEEQDPTILDKLTTDDELSGFFNWAVEGLKRLLERGSLNEPGDYVKRRELYLAMSDPVTGFFHEHVVEDPESFEVKQDVISAFHYYCKSKGVVSYSDRRFVEEFRRMANVRDAQVTLGDGSRARVWRGIRLGKSVEFVKGARLARDAQGSQTRLDEVT